MQLFDRFRPLRGEHRQLGREAERLAARHLKKQNYRILARNLRQRHGEIDLIAIDQDGPTLVIVEVKAGQADAPIAPELRVGPAKQRKLISLAATLARSHRLTHSAWRFDVVAVEYHQGKPPLIRHYANAFEVR
jgi:putative endonuclease